MYELIFNFSLKRRWHFLVWWLKGRHFRLNFQETDGVKLIFLPCQNLYDNYVFFVVSVIERLNVSVTLFKGSLRNNKLNFVFVVSLVVAIHCVKNMQIRSFSWSLFSSYCTEYWNLRSKCPYLVWMRENKDQEKLYIWTLFTQWLAVMFWCKHVLLLNYLSSSNILELWLFVMVSYFSWSSN